MVATLRVFVYKRTQQYTDGGDGLLWQQCSVEGENNNIKQIEIGTVDQSMLQAVWHESRISRSLV